MTAIDPLKLKSDSHLISSYKITPGVTHWVKRIKERLPSELRSS